ncbi:vacuolar protein sorting/targeting protein PEP1 [Blyttiomyces sp. JEL0837]|nr:vacuolar protein sorting/targeting protein PEP1 [Blyttiomyces sp. JEL0837]
MPISPNDDFVSYGNLYFSNSDGSYFTKSLSYNHRNPDGLVDFERVQSDMFSGTVLANVIKGGDSSSSDREMLATKISMDDGGHWFNIRPPKVKLNGDSWVCKVKESGNVEDKCSLHLHSASSPHNIGRVFSSSAAPGFLIGVGSVGEYLQSYDVSDTFISSDGGVSWVHAANGPHKYEILDQGGVVVLVPDNGGSSGTDYVLYSTKRGEPDSFKKLEVKVDGIKGKWKVRMTANDPEATSLRMVMFVTDSQDAHNHGMVQIDFGKVLERQCEYNEKDPGKSKDFELWSPKSGFDGKDVCLMGVDVDYYRRKKDVDCFVGRKFKNVDVKVSECKCGREDFECDFGFKVDESSSDVKCVVSGPNYDQPSDCKIGSKYKGSSGYRKIPGNKCKGGESLDEKVDRECGVTGGVGKSPTGKQPAVQIKKFDIDISHVIYLKKSKVVIAQSSDNMQVWRSGDEGVSWGTVGMLKDKFPVELIAVHDVDHLKVFVMTESDVYVSNDGLEKDLVKISTPIPYNSIGAPILDFHPTEKDWLVYLGSEGGCPNPKTCFTQVYITLENGKTWENKEKPIESWATKCLWAWDAHFGDGNTKLGKDAVYCASYKYKTGKVSQIELGGASWDDNPLQLVVISNKGKDRRVLIEKGVVDFYVVDEILVVAQEVGQGLRLLISTDGETFVEAKFPPNLKVEKNAFTILESNSGGVYMDVLQNTDQLYGSLFKSNSNGTFFSRILDHSNRKTHGIADIEKMKGIPGVLPEICETPKKGKDSKHFTEWVPHGKDGKDRCFLGQDLGFWRKKADAVCHVGREFEEIAPDAESCACTEQDFECDYNFFRDPDSGECKLYGVDPLQPANCKPGDTYKGSSGYRKIGISKCKNGVDLTKPKERVCGQNENAVGEPQIVTRNFKYGLSDYMYFKDSKTVIIRDISGRVWVSKDSGASWEQPTDLEGVDVDLILLDPYRNDRRAFFIGSGEFLHFTDDKGGKFKKVKLPTVPNTLMVSALMTHPEEEGYFLFVGEGGCESLISKDCKTKLFVSTDYGNNWSERRSYVQRCSFARDTKFKKPGKDSILCQVFDVDVGNQRAMNAKTKRLLVKSDDLGKNWKTELEASVGYAISHEFMVSATLEPHETELKLYVTQDGDEWVMASFENDDKIPDYGYTLLDSSSGSVFLEVFSSRVPGAEFGTLYHSIDNNGTNFKISLEHVNQDAKGYTDFEKMLGIKGMALASQVINPKSLPQGAKKKIRSKITFNDGESWSNLPAPKTDVNGDKYKCDDDECFLNLHHFTERSDANDLFSSPSAIGFIIGVGNVGDHLTKYNDGNTFLTRDAGRTWTEIAKDAHLYEFGNRGGVILLANNEQSVDYVKFSLDHGQTFKDFRISDSLGGKLRVTHIISEPFGSSSQFVVFGTIKDGLNQGDTAAVHLDFSKVWSRHCVLDKKNEDVSDFEAWSPGGPSQTDGCMFGKKTMFYRRKSDRECRVPEIYEAPAHVDDKPCECTIEDFECDAGYKRNSAGECIAPEGFVPPTMPCVNGIRKIVTGYVKSRKTECLGGKAAELEKTEYCAGPISGGGWFFILLAVIGIPLLVSFAIINLKKGGRIRLPMDSDERGPSANSHWTEKVSFAFTKFGIFIMEISELALAKGRHLYDWARGKMARNAGYAPVGSTPLDDEIDADPSLMDLEEGEED